MNSASTSTQRHYGGVNFTMVDGSVRALQQQAVTLTGLAQGLRQQGGSYRAFAFGTPGSVLDAVLSGLRRQGILPQDLPVRQMVAKALPLLLVMAPGEPRSSGLMFAATPPPGNSALLLPAVQSARESARRISECGPIELILVDASAGAGRSVPATDSMAFNFFKIDMR